MPINADSAETTVNGIKRSYSLDSQEFTFDGTNTKTDAAWLIYSINASDFVLNGLKPDVTYRFSHNLTADFYAQVTYNKSGGGIGSFGYLRGNAGRNASVSFTLPSDFSSLRQFQIGVVHTATDVNITAHFQIEVGSTATTYEAYVTPETLAVSWQTEAGTVYGGELNVTTGVLNVNYKYMSVNEVTQEYTNAGSGFYGGRITISDMKSNARANGYCETLVPVNSPSAQTINCVCFGANNTSLFIVMDENLIGTTLESMNEYLNDNPVNIVYPLATPTTYQLTPHELRTFLGANNFYCDTGDSQLNYRADISLYINNH